MKHVKYLKYVLRHKFFVFVACMKLRVSLWQALIHDWSKFMPIEWFPYVERFYGKNAYKPSAGTTGYFHKPGDDKDFDRAWLHHWSTNPHHWQYWIHKLPGYGPLKIGDQVWGVADNAEVFGRVVETQVSDFRPRCDQKVRQDANGVEAWYLNCELHDIVLPMPEKYVREMVADWYGAGMAQGKPDIWAWYAANKQHQTLHPQTRYLAEKFLDELKTKV